MTVNVLRHFFSSFIFQVVIDNGKSHTSSISRIVVPNTEPVIKIKELIIKGGIGVGFLPRNPQQRALKVQVDTITSEPTTNIYVDNGIEFQYATQSFVTKLQLRPSIFVSSLGVLSLPPSVTVRDNVIIDLCGLLTNVRNLTVTSNGRFRISGPRFVPQKIVKLESLAIDHLGTLERSSHCSSTVNVILDLDVFQKLNGSRLPSKFSLSPRTREEILSIAQAPFVNTTCPTGRDLRIYRGQSCELLPGDYNFSNLIIENGGKLIIRGDSLGVQKTNITTGNLIIKPTAILEGIGRGLLPSNSPSGSTRYGTSATHGGQGVANRNTYGNILFPTDYGSSGYAANSRQGYGGGQLKLTVLQTFLLDGIIDVSAKDGISSYRSGGSGGSLLIGARTLEGSGLIRSNGGISGGGGGRVAVYLTRGIYNWDGKITTLSKKGITGQGSSGKYTFYFI